MADWNANVSASRMSKTTGCACAFLAGFKWLDKRRRQNYKHDRRKRALNRLSEVNIDKTGTAQIAVKPCWSSQKYEKIEQQRISRYISKI
jgi:hypothetical protein